MADMKLYRELFDQMDGRSRELMVKALSEYRANHSVEDLSQDFGDSAEEADQLLNDLNEAFGTGIGYSK
jgi:hypothetical protein